MVYEVILGRAGTGKSTVLKARANLQKLELLATTGVAAINMGGQTLHSWLGYDLTRGIFNLRMDRLEGINGIAIDEISMADKYFMDKALGVLRNLEESEVISPDFLVLLCGDFAQLPPVADKNRLDSIALKPKGWLPWMFRSDYWENFSANTTRLTEIHRQSDPKFMEALGMAREGAGYDAAVALKKLGTQFTPSTGLAYDGMVMYATNDKVDSYNKYKLTILARDGRPTLTCVGQMSGNKDPITICKGAPIMLLANNLEAGWANGTTAEVIQWAPTTNPNNMTAVAGPRSPAILVKLTSGPCTGEERWIGAISRRTWDGNGNPGTYWFWPFRLAWATTIHKTQGLTLEKATVVTGEWFSNTPGAMYTALTRVKNPQDLTVVGTVDKLAERIQVAKEAKEWF